MNLNVTFVCRQTWALQRRWRRSGMMRALCADDWARQSSGDRSVWWHRKSEDCCRLSPLILSLRRRVGFSPTRRAASGQRQQTGPRCLPNVELSLAGWLDQIALGWSALRWVWHPAWDRDCLHLVLAVLCWFCGTGHSELAFSAVLTALAGQSSGGSISANVCERRGQSGLFINQAWL